MKPGGRQFLAGPTFPNQQHRPLDRGNPGKHFLKLEKRFGLAKRFCRSAWICFFGFDIMLVHFTNFDIIIPFIGNYILR